MHAIRTLSMTVLAALGAVTGTTVMAGPAHAEGRYNIMINTTNSFVADYCLLTSTSGNARAACSGNKGGASEFRLSAPHNTGDRVWIDVNIVAGKDRKGIDLRNMHMMEVSGNLVAVNVCGWKTKAAWDSNASAVTLHGPDCNAEDPNA